MKRPPTWLKRLLQALAQISEMISRVVDAMTHELIRIVIELLHAGVKLATLVAVIKFLFSEIAPAIARIWA